ncbi:MAG: FG-GAP-like repeat-containing protein [Ignavibacteria bacterium]|nr:FG-GAP-like repeat-containing protein [Ignavibacteria bacterium]
MKIFEQLIGFLFNLSNKVSSKIFKYIFLFLFLTYFSSYSQAVLYSKLNGTSNTNTGIINIPSSYNFGTKRVGSTNFWWMKIENQSTQPINIFSWNTSRSDFYLEANVFPMTIPANSFRYVRVWFKPNSASLISDTLRIINNSSNAPEAKIFLTGVGEVQNIPLGQTLWTHTIPNHPISNTFRTVKGVRAFNDITGDGKADVIVCTENYWTVALNGNSSGTNDTLWSFNTYISSSSAGSIGSAGDYSYQKALSIASDLNGDGFNDVVIGTGGGNETVYAINGRNGQMLWKFGTDHPDSFNLGDITGVDASTDFNNDGVPDVIAAASATQTGGVAGRRSVYLFNGTNGQIIWQRFVGGFTHAVTAIPDINDDGKPDVIATIGEPVYQFQALNGANGNLIWAYSVPSNTGGGKEVIVLNIPGQKPDVIAGAFWGQIYRLKGTTGLPIWTYSFGSSGAPTQMKILKDVTGDGIDEIAVSILSGGAACINGANGTAVWFKSTGNTMGVDIIPDLNGDGSDDVVFAVQNQGALIVNGSNGNDLALYSFGGSTQAREVATIPDLDGNGSREILVGSNLGNVAMISGGNLVQSASISVVSPNGGEVWYVNQNKFIKWTSSGVNNIKIELSTNDGSSWNLIASNFSASNGEYLWTVSGSPSTQCRIKITSIENPNVFDISDGVFTIKNQLCVSFNVNQNWNIVAVPVFRTNMTKNELFPTSVSNAYGFNQMYGYYSADTLANSKGYWLKFSSPQQITICGIPVESKKISVNAGWNMIGTFDSDVNVAAITTNPPNIIQSNFFGYNSGYFVTNELKSGLGYWIKVSQNGELILPQPGSTKIAQKNNLNIPESSIELTITDKLNNQAKLFLCDEIGMNNFSELPPLPPSEIFDVRFSSNKMIEETNQVNVILLQGVSYPLKIKTSKHQVKIESHQTIGFSEIVSPEKEILISDERIKMIFVSAIKIPDENQLYQNYPNPFNPTTKIRFDLKEKSLVKLKIYDVLGRELATLLNEEKDAGVHFIEIDSRKLNLTSGIYFYRLFSNNYQSIKKMILTK